jgi:hypothetical protein
MQFIQFNIRPARRAEELLLLDCRCSPIELDANFGGCFASGAPDGCLVVHPARCKWQIPVPKGERSSA